MTVAADAVPAFSTAELSDRHGEGVQVAEPGLLDYGGLEWFAGPIATCRVRDDNSRVRELLETPGEGRVLVVDGGASRVCALLGDRLAALACANGWRGVVVWGCIRDSAAIRAMPLGVRALATHPRRSRKRGTGEVGVTVEFAGLRCAPGAWLYADPDGLLVAPAALA